MKKHTFYIYCLYYNEKPFYVGASNNPAARLFCHVKDNGGHPMGKFMAKIKDVCEVKMQILQAISIDINKVSGQVVKYEQYWICRFISEGHKLSNKLISNRTIIRKKYLKQIIKENEIEKIRSKDKRRKNISRAGKRSKEEKMVCQHFDKFDTRRTSKKEQKRTSLNSL